MPPKRLVAKHSGVQSSAWRASIPLICFDIVEVHLPERVMRQYGMVQGIPPPCDTEVELHLTSRKGQGRRIVARSTSNILLVGIIAWSCLPKVRRSMQLA